MRLVVCHNYLRIIIIMFTITLSCTTSAQEERKTSRSMVHGIGLAAGGTSGVGISYRGWWPSNFGLRSTLGAFGTSRYFDMFGGMELLYNFHVIEDGYRSYILVGSGFIVESWQALTLIPGLGAGIEFLLWKKLTISIGISLAPYVGIARPPNPILGYWPLPFPAIAMIYNL